MILATGRRVAKRRHLLCPEQLVIQLCDPILVDRVEADQAEMREKKRFKEFRSSRFFRDYSLVLIEHGAILGVTSSFVYFLDTFWEDRALFAIDHTWIDTINEIPMEKRPIETTVAFLRRLQELDLEIDERGW